MNIYIYISVKMLDLTTARTHFKALFFTVALFSICVSTSVFKLSEVHFHSITDQEQPTVDNTVLSSSLGRDFEKVIF